MRDVRCRESVETIRAALVGNYQPEHVFALAQALSLYDSYLARIADCDAQIEQTLLLLSADKCCRCTHVRAATALPHACDWSPRRAAVRTPRWGRCSTAD